MDKKFDCKFGYNQKRKENKAKLFYHIHLIIPNYVLIKAKLNADKKR